MNIANFTQEMCNSIKQQQIKAIFQLKQKCKNLKINSYEILYMRAAIWLYNNKMTTFCFHFNIIRWLSEFPCLQFSCFIEMKLDLIVLAEVQLKLLWKKLQSFNSTQLQNVFNWNQPFESYKKIQWKWKLKFN